MDLPTEIIYEILKHCNPNDYSEVCTLWREIARHYQRKIYIEQVVLQSGETTEFVSGCYDDYMENWL